MNNRTYNISNTHTWSHTWSESHTRDEEVLTALQFNLREYNRSHIPDYITPDHTAPDAWDYTIAIHDDDGNLRGGLVTKSHWGAMYLDHLWIHDDLRGQHIGQHLLEMAEDEARKHGDRFIWTATFSFQAKGFYERHGYRVVGELTDFPPGHNRYTLRKDLNGDN